MCYGKAEGLVSAESLWVADRTHQSMAQPVVRIIIHLFRGYTWGASG